MSKASEYAARIEAARQQPESFSWQDGDKTWSYFKAAVNADGHLYADGVLPPSQIANFVNWIVETFYEKTGSLHGIS